MRNLKNSLIFIAFSNLSCQSTKVFELKTFPAVKQNHFDAKQVISVTSDRVQQECVFLNAEAENNWRHQYFIHVLNDVNEVLEIMYPTHMDKDSCYTQIREVDKILRTEPRISLCVHGEIKSIQSDKLIKFSPPLGNYPTSYKALNFDSICNSKTCYGDNSAWSSTCPGFTKH